MYEYKGLISGHTTQFYHYGISICRKAVIQYGSIYEILCYEHWLINLSTNWEGNNVKTYCLQVFVCSFFFVNLAVFKLLKRHKATHVPTFFFFFFLMTLTFKQQNRITWGETDTFLNKYNETKQVLLLTQSV